MEKNQKITIIRIIISALIFVASLFMNSTLSLILLIAAYLIAGYDILIKAVRTLFRGLFLDENFLMTIASIGAFLIGEYSEAVFVILFYKVGELFEDYAAGKSRKSVKALTEIMPSDAVVIREGKEISVLPSEIEIGETVLIRPGEKIPVDGKIIKGESFMDTRALTGESVPRSVSIGDELLSGFINTSGVIHMEALKREEESTAAKILELTLASTENKSKSEKFISVFARVYTPIVVSLAVLLALLPPLFGGEFKESIRNALVFLVVSCPCALVISVPLSYFGGIGAASKKGILVKGSNYLDELRLSSTFVFDKTGTLTDGSFKVTKIAPENLSEEELLHLAASGEYYSLHPIALSIKERAEGAPPESFEEISGKGIKALVSEGRLLLGNKALLSENEVSVPEIKETVGTLVFAALNGNYIGYILISDSLKPAAENIGNKLRALGIRKVGILSGDNSSAVEWVKNKSAADFAVGELLPAGKAQHIEELKGTGKVAFIGDGINDSPVLALSDVGISIGNGASDAAIEASDIVLLDDNPEKIVSAIKIAKKTHTIVIENIVFSLAVKGIVLCLAALGLANMWLASFADVGVAVIAILNAMRMLKLN